MKQSVKKNIVAMLATLVPLLLPAVNSVSYTASYRNLSVRYETLSGATYATVAYSGLSNGYELGMPSLPIDYLQFSVPVNATNFTVEANCQNLMLKRINNPVYPFQEFTIPATITQPDSAFYSSSATYPSSNGWVIDDDCLVGENRIVTVAVMPISFMHDATGNTLKVASTVQVTLNYELSSEPTVYPITRKGVALRGKGADLVSSMVVNPDDVVANSYSWTFNSYPPGPDLVDNPSTYLIVTTPELKQSMRRLAALKRQKGLPVKIVTVQEAIADSLAGDGDLIEWGGTPSLTYTDNAGKLRQYLRMNYYYNGTEYVLLAGSDVPSRYKGNGYTDMYYSDLNADWATQSDKGGELNVGRLLGTQKGQIENYTDKLFRYELNPGNGDRSYLERPLVIEGTGLQMSGGVTQLSPAYSDGTLLSADDEAFTGSDIVNEVNQHHYGLMTTMNNGFPSGIQPYGEDVNSVSHYLWAVDSVKVAPGVTDNETGNGLNLMTNKDYPMIYLAFRGQTMPYENVSGYPQGVNYGESFTMGKDYGGPAFMGLTQEINLSYESAFANRFTHYLLYDNSVLGEAMTGAKLSANFGAIGVENVVTGYNLLGDPSLDMWINAPQPYSGITISRADSSMTVSGLTDPKTTVAYHSNDGVTGKVTASSSSVTLNNVSPNSCVMLYNHERIPYIAPLVLQNTDLENSQYVIAGEVTAGYNVDSGRTRGDVTVKSGAEYEVEASGEVTLGGGFNVERGALFTIKPSTYDK